MATCCATRRSIFHEWSAPRDCSHSPVARLAAHVRELSCRGGMGTSMVARRAVYRSIPTPSPMRTFWLVSPARQGGAALVVEYLFALRARPVGPAAAYLQLQFEPGRWCPPNHAMDSGVAAANVVGAVLRR